MCLNNSSSTLSSCEKGTVHFRCQTPDQLWAAIIASSAFGKITYKLNTNVKDKKNEGSSVDWWSDIYSHWSLRRPEALREFCNSTFLLAQDLQSVPLTYEKSFSSALLKQRWLGQNASGWNLGFIRCCLRKNTYGSSRKH